jgi:hypothetical protein
MEGRPARRRPRGRSGENNREGPAPARGRHIKVRVVRTDAPKSGAKWVRDDSLRAWSGTTRRNHLWQNAWRAPRATRRPDGEARRLKMSGLLSRADRVVGPVVAHSRELRVMSRHIDLLRAPRATLGVCAAALLASAALVVAQPVVGLVRGEVLDDSDGVLPGVTVLATAAGDHVLARAITDHVGRYVLPALPAGPVTLVFHLEGFEPASVAVTVQPGGESSVVSRLQLGAVTEDVVVYGTAPAEPPVAVAAERRAPLRPAVAVIPPPHEDLETICRPAKAALAPESVGTIHSHLYDAGRTLYGKGDELNIQGGTLDGLAVGRNLLVRRLYRANSPADLIAAFGEHTSGLVQIVAATEHTATAVVVYACNELRQGDVLASFSPESARTPDPVGLPDYDAAARILFADAGQMLGMPGRLMVIDQGLAQGIHAGQRLTLFRRGGTAPLVIGHAVVISARDDSATIRVERAADAIWFGDLAAPQRHAPEATTSRGSSRPPW